ncbi:hypothetical protein PVAP13_5KG124687 [Panicum virgatum]|uniref:Uncharacterized protein n=1 Tax=Panicum virgatum TaxID=38727 RepID=A0A8T0SF22_PANVG|nr:hypothetical protein PVAP13_5KG124687 [Panicum virgatum]KAG2595994.1 hypothetical protein PVAP13_5KG124687 [Panicum virgatum]
MTIAGGGRVCFYRAGEGSLKGRFSIPALCNSSLPFFYRWAGRAAGQIHQIRNTGGNLRHIISIYTESIMKEGNFKSCYLRFRERICFIIRKFHVGFAEL